MSNHIGEWSRHQLRGQSTDKQTPPGSTLDPSGAALDTSLIQEVTSDTLLVTRIMSSDTKIKLGKVFEIVFV